MTEIYQQIGEAVENGDAEAVAGLVGEAMEGGRQALEILEEGLVPGIQLMGKLFQDGTVYLPDILVACRAMNRGVALLQPELGKINMPHKGTVVIGTIEGDMHDIGKNLVKMMLESVGFEVEDLGTDVLPETFVAAVRDCNADILAISSLLTTTMVGVSDVIDALAKAGLRDKVKIIIGGAPVTPQFADKAGADGFGEDFVSAVDVSEKWMEELAQ
jgi:5-methyltetrahydrofolate--homocysteine methyltransferase